MISWVCRVVFGVSWTLFVVPTAGIAAEYGDLNCDGDVNVVDVQLGIFAALDLPLSQDLDGDQNGYPDACDAEPPSGICGVGTLLDVPSGSCVIDDAYLAESCEPSPCDPVVVGCPDPKFLATSFTTLSMYTIEGPSKSLTFVAETGGVPFRALAFDRATSTLYGSSGGALYEIDMDNGSPTLVGEGLGSVEAMAWVNGKLLGCAFNGGSELWEIDIHTGTLAGVVGDMGIKRVRGLAYDENSGVLYGVHLPQTWMAIGVLLAIDPQTGETEEIGSTGMSGLANLAISPADGSLWGLQDEGGPDFLVAIDPATGVATKEAESLGVDGLRGLVLLPPAL